MISRINAKFVYFKTRALYYQKTEFTVQETNDIKKHDYLISELFRWFINIINHFSAILTKDDSTIDSFLVY